MRVGVHGQAPYMAREGTAWVQFFAQLFLPPLACTEMRARFY